MTLFAFIIISVTLMTLFAFITISIKFQVKLMSAKIFLPLISRNELSIILVSEEQLPWVHVTPYHLRGH